MTYAFVEQYSIQVCEIISCWIRNCAICINMHLGRWLMCVAPPHPTKRHTGSSPTTHIKAEIIYDDDGCANCRQHSRQRSAVRTATQYRIDINEGRGGCETRARAFGSDIAEQMASFGDHNMTITFRSFGPHSNIERMHEIVNATLRRRLRRQRHRRFCACLYANAHA